MLSMFKDKKGFSALFDEKLEPSEQRQSATHLSLQQRSLHRCERCGKHFSEPATAPQPLFVCAFCEYPTCPHCREESKHPKYGSDWLCCECNGPQSFNRLFTTTRVGMTIASKILEFCDVRSERIMISLYRNAIPFVSRVCASVSASKKIKMEKSNIKGGGLSSRTPNQSTRRSSRKDSSKSALRHPFVVSEEKENSVRYSKTLRDSEIRLSECSNIGETRKSNLTPFEREPPRTVTPLNDQARTTCGSVSLSAEPVECDNDSSSARSESPAPRFPTFTEFLDQASVLPPQENPPSTGLISVSPNSEDDVVRLDLRVSGKRSSRHLSGKPLPQSPSTTKKSSSSAFTSRSVHRILFCSESNANSPVAQVSNPSTPAESKKSLSVRNTPTEVPAARKRRAVHAPLSTRTGGKTLGQPVSRQQPSYDENGRRVTPSSSKLQRNASKTPNFTRNASRNANFERNPSKKNFDPVNSSEALKRSLSDTKIASQRSSDSKFSSTASSTQHLGSPKTTTRPNHKGAAREKAESNNNFNRTASLTVIPGTKLARTPSARSGLSGSGSKTHQMRRTNTSANFSRNLSTNNGLQRTKSCNASVTAKTKSFTRCATETTKRSSTPHKTSAYTRTNTKNTITGERNKPRENLRRTNTSNRFEETPTSSKVGGEAPPRLVHMTRRRRNPQAGNSGAGGTSNGDSPVGFVRTAMGTKGVRNEAKSRTLDVNSKTAEKFRRNNSSSSPLVRLKSKTVL